MLHSEKAFEGLPIEARDGAIGKIKDTYFDDEHWVVRYVVVDTGKWLESRPVLLATAQLQPDSGRPGLRIAATKEQVRQSPAADTERPVSRQHEQHLHDHYGWPYYWGMAPIAGIGMPVVLPPMNVPSPAAQTAPAALAPERAAALDEQPDQRFDPHLRSADEVRSYRLEARDGLVGHIDDLLVDDQRWTIRYLVVDTRQWWPGRKVLLPPRAVTALRWPEERVSIPLSREEIKKAPEFDATHMPSEPYLAALDAYYRHLGPER